MALKSMKLAAGLIATSWFLGACGNRVVAPPAVDEQAERACQVQCDVHEECTGEGPDAECVDECMEANEAIWPGPCREDRLAHYECVGALSCAGYEDYTDPHYTPMSPCFAELNTVSLCKAAQGPGH
ncbi:MAG: hypothetical protein JKY37_27955 [Nannocystaceae bacterium]|nr:hypothetical protein [Nannocystaceae bacterium]